MKSAIWFPSLALALALSGAAKAAEVTLLAPGVVANAGLRELATAFTRQTGITVTIKGEVMGRILATSATGDPAADVVFLPLSLMDSLQASGGAKPGTRRALGRVDIGLALPSGTLIPDISTTAKLATVLRLASAVTYSDPRGGSMQAKMIDDLLKRSEFAGVKTKVSTGGQGGDALARGEADMALQLICEIIDHPELVNAGPLPLELGAYIDTATAVSARAPHPTEADQFVRYITRPEAAAVWRAKGLVRTAP